MAKKKKGKKGAKSPPKPDKSAQLSDEEQAAQAEATRLAARKADADAAAARRGGVGWWNVSLVNFVGLPRLALLFAGCEPNETAAAAAGGALPSDSWITFEARGLT